MSNGIYLTLEQYKDKDLPLTITVNGNTYHSQFALATTQTTWFEMGKQHGMELGGDKTYSDKDMTRYGHAWYDEGYTKGYDDGYDAGIDHGIEKTLQDDRVKEELERTKQTWYAEGKEAGYGDGYEDGKKEGYEAGKSESYGRGWIEGHNEASIKQFDEYSVKLEERYKSKYDAGYNDGYEQCKHDGISKKNVNTESVEQTELSKEYDKGFTKGYEEGFEEGKSEGYEIGKKANGISKKEIPGEYLSHIEEARKQGYADGYKDCREVANCREVAKMLNKYGIDEDGPCNDCKEEPGRDDDEPIGPEQTEYAKGYEDGRMDIMQFIGNNRG